MRDGTRLKKLRVQRGLSQRELAESISIDRSMISLYENDHREIQPEIPIHRKPNQQRTVSQSILICFDVEEQNRIIGYIHGILDSKKGK